MTTFTQTISRINPEVTVSQALPDDIPAVTQLLIRTAEWLQSRGSSQWNGLLRGEDSHHTPDAIRRGDVFIFKKEAQLVGMLMLLQQASDWDRKLWGEEGHASSVYLHRLAINRDASGRNLGAEMMRWAESGIRFPGKKRIRLDCIADNLTLNTFYAGLGYEYVGKAENALGQFSKYEKIVTD